MAQEYQNVQIRIKVGNNTSTINAVCGEFVGAAVIFAQSNPITSLDQIGKIYYLDSPNRSVNPRQLLRSTDQGKTFVVESSPFPLQCSTSELTDGENCIPYSFDILTNRENGGGFPIAVTVNGQSGDVPAELVENGTSYKVGFTPKSEGSHNVTVTFQVTATVNINVGSMVPDPHQCVAYGPGLETAEQYKPANFTIEARNKLGQKIPHGGHPFTAKCKGPFGEDIPVDLVDNGDGTFSATYVPILAGNHVIEVRLKEDNIKDSPFTVPVEWSSEFAHPHLSYAEGPGLVDGINKTRQNEPSHFTIFAVDKNGNRKTTGGDLFAVDIEDPLFDQVPATVVDNGDGTYGVTYQAKEPGTNNISIYLRNTLQPTFYEHIKDSPKPVTIKSGTDPSKCTAQGPGLVDGIEDIYPAEFKVQARDRNGNPITEGGEPFKAVVRDPNGKEVPCDLSDNGDGTYDVVYHPDVPGPHTVDVTLDNDHIKDMPRKVNVVPGAWAGTSVIETLTVSVRSRDKRGKDITVGGQAPQAEIKSNDGSLIPHQLLDRNDGTYTYTFKPVATGDYKANITIKGSPIVGSPFEMKF